jgi:hypothetical protein
VSEAEAGEPALPDIGEVCLHFPLYRVIAKGDQAQAFADKLHDESFQLDAYCIHCKRETPFKKLVLKINTGTGVTPSLRRAATPEKRPASLFQSVNATCARCGSYYFFYFASYREGIAKIGQTPSPADIASQDMLRFREELGDLDLAELEYATRMFSLGIGVASYVYLRRIFERLLGRHHAAYVEAHGAIEGYERMRWEDRVQALRSVLPEELVENRKVYSILSLGIHELMEADCLRYYPVMRAAIVDILEQDIAAKRRAEASAELRRAVGRIADQLKPAE